MSHHRSCHLTPNHRLRTSSILSSSSKGYRGKELDDARLWESVLGKIKSIQSKVRSLSKKRKTVSKHKTQNSPTKKKRNQTKDFTHSLNFNNSVELPFETSQFLIRTPLEPQLCNSTCHQIMRKVESVEKRNRDLQREKYMLIKQIRMKDKENKELFWELEKQKQSQIMNSQKSTLDFIFVNPIEDIHRIEKTKPTKGRAFNRIQSNLKENTSTKRTGSLSSSQELEKTQQQESLLLESLGSSSIHNSRKPNQNQNILQVKVYLEKKLNGLLQISHIEKDKEKKHRIRKQMEMIAKSIKEIKKKSLK